MPTIEENKERFETLLCSVKREGIDKLLDYIRRTDFYTAPASTKFHLACEGHLLNADLNGAANIGCKALPEFLKEADIPEKLSNIEVIRYGAFDTV